MGLVPFNPARWDALYLRALLFARAVKSIFAECITRAQSSPLLPPPPDAQYTSEWPSKWIRPVADMAETARDFDEVQLAYGAWLAASCRWVRSSDLTPGPRNLDECPKFFAIAGIVIRGLHRTEDEWATKPPRAELVMFRWSDDWGALIDKHTLPEIACHLAAAIADERFTVRQAEAIVGQHWGKELAPWLARELAAAAVDTVCRTELQGTADTDRSEEGTAAAR